MTPVNEIQITEATSAEVVVGMMVSTISNHESADAALFGKLWSFVKTEATRSEKLSELRAEVKKVTASDNSELLDATKRSVKRYFNNLESLVGVINTGIKPVMSKINFDNLERLFKVGKLIKKVPKEDQEDLQGTLELHLKVIEPLWEKKSPKEYNFWFRKALNELLEDLAELQPKAPPVTKEAALEAFYSWPPDVQEYVKEVILTSMEPEEVTEAA